MVRLRFAASAALLCLLLASPASAQESKQVPVKSGEECAFPTDLLWHQEAGEGRHKMGVSVRNANGQQVPGLTADNFDIRHKGAKVTKGDTFEVSQSKNVLNVAQKQAEEEGDETPAVATGDPVSYDVYFVLDLTSSMADQIQGAGGRSATKQAWISNLVAALIRPDKKGRYALFDQNDRVYISGFTSKLHTTFMEGPTTKRDVIAKALLAANEFAPKDSDARLYGAIHHSLDTIKAAAAEYADPAKRRQAVVITITDSFNGIDPARGRRVRGCAENDAWNDVLRQAILDTRQATAGNFKMYLLGLGALGDTDKYKVQDAPGRGCSIRDTQNQVLDGRSFAAIADPKLTSGGFFAHSNPSMHVKWLMTRFEALKTAYEVTYDVPKNSPEPGLYRVRSVIAEEVCEALREEQTSFVALATKKTQTTAGEMALLLASLLIATLFLPRSLANLGTLGGGGGSSAPPKKKGKKKKRRK